MDSEAILTEGNYPLFHMHGKIAGLLCCPVARRIRWRSVRVAGNFGAVRTS